MTLDVLLQISPWMPYDAPRLSSYIIHISQLIHLAWCCTWVYDLGSKYVQITSKLLS